MMNNKGKGWKESPDASGKAPRHVVAANMKKLNDTARIPYYSTNPPDPKYGKDWEIEIKGILITPDLKTFIMAEQQKWDETISPTVPSKFHNRYTKTMLFTGDSLEYIEFKKRNPKWHTIDLYESISKLIKRHSSEIPKGSIPRLDVLKTKSDSLPVEDELNPMRHRIVGVGIYMSRGLYEPYIVDESYSWNDSFSRFTKRYSISEFGSPFMDKLLNRYSNRVFIEKFSESISSLIHTYQIFLLGKEGLRDYYETVEDRALVEALSHGAVMDEEGYIVDPITGTKL